MPYELVERRAVESSGLDLEAVLATAVSEAPCGPDLEYHPEFLAVDRAVRPISEKLLGDATTGDPTDWPEVRRRCEALLARSKDLRIAIAYLRALTHTEQLPGFAFGMQVIDGLTGRYWEDLHPSLDAAEDGDATMRLNALAGLAPQRGSCAEATVLRDLRSALVTPDDGGRVTVQDILDMGTAVGEADTDLAQRRARNEAILRAACARPNPAVSVWLSAPRRALEALDALGARLATLGPSAHVPDLAPLRGLLHTIAKAIDAARAGAGAGTPDPQRAAEQSQAPGPELRVGRPVHCREDATRAIEAVCAYLERAEPASPAPLLLRRAQRLMRMSFLDAVADLAPGGLEQLRTVAGIEDGR